MENFLRLALILWSFAAFASVSEASARIKTVLKLKQRAPMSSLVAQLSDPSSPHFQKPFTPAEITKEIGLSDAEYRKLVTHLQKRGFHLLHEDTTRGYLIVDSSAETVERTFQVKFQFENGGKHFTSARETIPADLSAVESIVNLDSRVVFRPRFRAQRDAQAGTQVGTSAAPDDGPTSGLGADDIAKMYEFDQIHQQGFTGKGQKIATVAFDAVNPDNVKKYLAYYELSSSPDVQAVPVAGGVPQIPCPNELACDNEIEDDVDLEMAGRVAPDATLLSFVGTTDDYLAGWVAIFTTILDRGDIFIVNNSDDSGVDPAGSSAVGCEAMLATSDWIGKVDPIFERAAAQGVQIFSASGDNGSDNCGDGTQGLDWPKSPYIVLVGGTDLEGTTEVGWSGSGGGYSVLYPRPAWQKGLPDSVTMRATPDVALFAGSSQAIYTVPFGGAPTPTWWSAGGTSLSSPTMAGFIAVVNGARLAHGKKILPYLNPILYSMSDQDRASCFNDIVGGSNGAYTAAAGWDAVTGFGSPKGAELFKYLVAYP